MLPILGLMVNMIRGIYLTINHHEIFTLFMKNEDIHMSFNYVEANDYGHNLELLIISH
jgi:hypothetical protein